DLEAVGVGAERLGIAHAVRAGSHAGAGEVEADGDEPALGEEGAEVGKEAPLHEPFETVADHHRRPRTGVALRIGQIDEPVEGGAGRGAKGEGSRGGHTGNCKEKPRTPRTSRTVVVVRVSPCRSVSVRTGDRLLP